MSIVYRALDRRLNRSVAVKVLPPELSHDPAVRTRFAREAHTSAQLSHPNIVPIHDVGERDGIVFLVMSLVTGENLATYLARDPRPPLTVARRIIAEVAEALGYAHQRGVIHRDVKPDNILIDRESGRVLVTDFGIARAVEAGSRLTQTGIAVGTPTYMSPEQATGDRGVDGRSDIYALGVVAYQMLTGRVPFAAQNTMALLLKHVTERPVPIGELRPDAPRAVRETIERAMAKSPDDRWPTAASLREAILSDDLPATSWRPEREPVRYTSPHPDARRRDRSARPTGDSPSPVPAVDPMRARPLIADLGPGQPPVVLEPSHVVSLTPGQREDLRLWHGRAHLYDRVKAMRWHARYWLLLAGSSMMASIAGLADPEAAVLVLTPIVPALMFRKLRQRAKSLRESGLSVRRVLLSPLASWVLPKTARPERQRRSRRKPEAPAPLPVPTSSRGRAVRQATEDRDAILQLLKGLSREDRAMLPDLVPTVDALVQRVTSLADMVERADEGINPALAGEIELRLRATEQEAAGVGRDRRIAFLEKQRATLDEMIRHRDELREQMESAALALGSLRLDVIRWRSSGLPSAMADVSTATQEARALSRDIGMVLEAMSEARRST